MLLWGNTYATLFSFFTFMCKNKAVEFTKECHRNPKLPDLNSVAGFLTLPEIKSISCHSINSLQWKSKPISYLFISKGRIIHMVMSSHRHFRCNSTSWSTLYGQKYVEYAVLPPNYCHKVGPHDCIECLPNALAYTLLFTKIQRPKPVPWQCPHSQSELWKSTTVV